MNNLLDKYELIDISSSSEEEGEITRASTLLPRANKEYPRIIVEILNSSAEATADEEEFLDLSLDSLESECKRMKLSEPYTSFETVESGQYPQSESPEEIVMADSPESPDESLSSDIFVVETSANDKESITSSKIAEYLGKVHQEDASSYFNTPPGTPKKDNFLAGKPFERLGEESTDEHHYYNNRLTAQSPGQRQSSYKSGPVTARSRSGLWLPTTEDRERTWKQSEIPQILF